MSTAARVAGVAEITGRLGQEITELVQEVHAASSPRALLLRDARPAEFVYRWVRLGFGGVTRLGALGGRWLDDGDDAWLGVQSALCGVCGDRLAAEASPLALPMRLLRPAPRPTARRLLVFLHGLCMSERGWAGPEHEAFAGEAAAQLDAEVAYLRYNTGLRISTNGAALARLLTAEARGRELVLVGHSMGGLLAVSAAHQARAAGFAWPGRLRGIACLASPFEGAALERIGNHANRLLRVSPWTRPFMRLGNLRSDGIRDLRFGHLLETDWCERQHDAPEPRASTAELAPDVPHLLIAATRSPAGAALPLSDWLVAVASAHALHTHPAAAAERALIPELDHIGSMRDPRTYARLRGWLAAL